MLRRSRRRFADASLELIVGVPAETPWIRAYALRPRHLTHGGWVWLRPYEWRWGRPAATTPLALRLPFVESRRAPPSARRGPTVSPT